MQIDEQVPLAAYTTLQVGGPARYLVTVTQADQLAAVRDFITQHQVPYLVMSGGSNLLVGDAGFAGVVVHNQITGRSYEEQPDGTVLATYGAGEVLDEVIAETVERGLWGLENLSHIPGSVGATPIQNVGAYGVEVADLITSVTAYNLTTGEVTTFTPKECQFAYRESWFKTDAGRAWCITSVTFRLETNPAPVLTYKDLQALAEQSDTPTQDSIRQAVISVRSQKFPDWTVVGTAGSFFKNPIIPRTQAEALQEQYPDLPVYPVTAESSKVSLGYILDKICDLKSCESGAVGLYKEQALVLTNTGSSAADIVAFVAEVRRVVQEKTGITIEQEVRSV